MAAVPSEEPVATMPTMYVPVLMTTTASMYDQAEKLRQEAAQLKAKAQQMRINENAVKNIPSYDSFDDSPWQSPCASPRRFDYSSDASTEDDMVQPGIKNWCDATDEDEVMQSPRIKRWSDACDKDEVQPYEQSTSIPCQIQYSPQITTTLVPMYTAATVACFVAPCPQTSWSSWESGEAVNRDGVQTTLILRNLPNDYTRDMVLNLLDAEGFHGTYDFFYLPVDFQSCSGLGYGFVNFCTNALAEHAMAILNGFRDWTVPSHKVLEVSWSELSQGLEANIERYRNSSILHPSVPEEFKPLLFSRGVPVSFPSPSRPVRQPRLKMISPDVKPIVDLPLRQTPWERINRTISILNSGDISEIIANAKNTLCSKLDFIVPEVASGIHSVGGVCAFHRQLHDAIPDLHVTLDHVGKEGDGATVWRASCTGTQLKKFIPGLPIDAQAKFNLEVTVKEGTNGRPMWLQWNFVIDCELSTDMTALNSIEDAQMSEKELSHRRGDCQPCAYFAFRADGCRQGDDCEFCHLCTKSQAKSKKKQRAQQLKEQEQLKAGLDAPDAVA